ncbi:helix-turn-helix domain-containing protein [Pedobacter heparinus]|uniref:HTH araC/xylS-type domain-containing protein n=1 Tax=Pedobacter heparinus (strain ATCC 13125 / DSM 2366 / CIP 104194 / JCM 7457 / NBRC 12017 / NCIMB 9290 / NRRL B-14731 / HIM 762-3) TaxID=485917 RepID=C6XVG0_PEDHD|nr:helix-turn-helix domain-containing protein [Pedobacter heparinus]ACU04026.1 hypothetical protein Phep_1817 [Pedobacter heparinus DSM 2366]
MSIRNMDFSYATPDMQIVLKLQALIDMHFKRQKQGDYYADVLGENVFRLNRLAFDYLGKTVYELIYDRVLEEVERMMLGNVVSSMQEMAEDLGFSGPDYLFSYINKVSVRLCSTSTLAKS